MTQIGKSSASLRSPRSPRSSRSVRPLVPWAALALVVTVAGCSSTDPAPTTPATSGTATTGEATPSAVTTTSAPSSAKPTTTSATGGAEAAPGACSPSDVAVTAPSPDGAGAGHVWYAITVENTSSSTCTIEGFPGVSLVSEEGGKQVGAPAKRTATGPILVTLKPGESTSAPLQYTQAGTIGAGCQLTPSAGFRIYLPEQTAAVFVRQELQACANGETVLLEVSPFGTSP